jgi:hypothetical protein
LIEIFYLPNFSHFDKTGVFQQPRLITPTISFSGMDVRRWNLTVVAMQIAHVVNGTIAIESKPMHGTTIHFRVPVESEHRSELAG